MAALNLGRLLPIQFGDWGIGLAFQNTFFHQVRMTQQSKIYCMLKIFQTADLVPLLEKYTYIMQRDVGPPSWVVDTLLDAGVSHDVLLRILDDMFWRNEVPFEGNSRRRLVRDAVFTADKWFSESLKGRTFGGARATIGSGFKPEAVAQLLEAYLRSGVEFGPEIKLKLERLVNDIKRKYLYPQM